MVIPPPASSLAISEPLSGDVLPPLLALELAAPWSYLVAFFTFAIAIIAASHAIIYKRDSRAAVLWVGFIWLVPILGALLYMLLGVNRIRRRAASLRQDLPTYTVTHDAEPCLPEQVAEVMPDEAVHLRKLSALLDKIMVRPLIGGNRLSPLRNGDEAYPAMLRAISEATQSISLSTYIFDNDSTGLQFVDALSKAVQRGVEVRVLVDDTGARYSFPTIIRTLRKANIPFARFLRTYGILRPMTMNLRNHRKTLVVDGTIGFTGGMNIRRGHVIAEKTKHPVQDLHFKVEGPVVSHLQESFAGDWLFTTGEALRGDVWFPNIPQAGEALARGIPDGPDEDFEKLRWTLLGAIMCAERSVRIVTPYFLPDQSIISALNIASMRGVEVDIVLPEKNNLPYVQWAMFATLWQVLIRGCRVWLTPPPFDHSKLLVIDRHWAMVGSANWDPRSLRLNFEFNLECYDTAFASAMDDWALLQIRAARPVHLQDVDSRSIPVRLRDGIFRLFTPFL